MKRTFTYLFLLAVVLLSSCKNEQNKYLLLGKKSGRQWFEPTPFGMAYIKRGAYNIGTNDDQLNGLTPNKMVSTEAFGLTIPKLRITNTGSLFTGYAISGHVSCWGKHILIF